MDQVNTIEKQLYQYGVNYDNACHDGDEHAQWVWSSHWNGAEMVLINMGVIGNALYTKVLGRLHKEGKRIP